MMNSNHAQQNLFHKFVLSADSLPNEANIFPYFEFMDLSIRKTFHQLKKTGLKKGKNLTAFQELWAQLNSEQRVHLYCKWVGLLKKALQMEKNQKFKSETASVTMQDQIYIKTAKLFNKWDKRIAKLTPTHLLIISNRKTKQYELKELQIRKSKSKQNFSWVLHSVRKTGKILHCGANNQNNYNQWFYALISNIDNQRVEYFYKNIKLERQNPGAFRIKFQEQKQIEKEDEPETVMNKTLTEMMIDQQMKTIDKQDLSDISYEDDNKKEKVLKEEFLQKNSGNEEIKVKQNPNIFKKLVPEYQSILDFADTPVNCPLLHCTTDYRIYQLPSNEENTSRLKFFTVLPFPKSLIFAAITAEVQGWNDDIDVLTVKTNVSSENTVLFYEKIKPHGILYRQRDFLYLRHCFEIVNLKQKNTFIIDKSIDSIHQPPFMTVVRAQKQLIWGLIEKQKDKQCIMIVEGWVKGGGYMNQVQNRQMTMKFMKKLLNLNGFLKQLSFSSTSKAFLLKQSWKVDMEKATLETVSKIQKKAKQEKESESDASDAGKEDEKIMKKNIQKEEEMKEMEEFMKRTTEEHLEDILSEERKSEVIISEEKFHPQEYKPPEFTENGEVIIPQNHLKIEHILKPKEKPKKPKYFPHFRGHHVWKGEWEVINPGGGLAYVDQQKMKEQKKVLTYIIKRIGKNIFSGKGILNISLPVDIFCIQSNIERLAMSFGYFPMFLQKAAMEKDPEIQMKYVMGAGIGSSMIYLTMEKPFNPILGETFQCWVDQCPIYFEQVSHHPPIAAFMMYGRGYRTYGCVEAKMDLSINSGTGNNEGVFTIEFDNGNTIHFTTPAGCLTGLTYGDRKLTLVGKSYYWTKEGIFAELTYNPGAKNKSFFGGAKGEGEQKLADYFEGVVKKFQQSEILNVAFKQVGGRTIPIIPKSSPSSNPLKNYYKVNGRWNKYLFCDGQKIFDIDETRYYQITPEETPLPSHSNYREDIVYRRMKNFVTSQDFKEELEKKQREDRKLRTKFSMSSSH